MSKTFASPKYCNASFNSNSYTDKCSNLKKSLVTYFLKLKQQFKKKLNQ